MDLIDFLRARLDEDEQAARTASPSPWKDPEEDESESLWLTREDAYHIYRWEPARVLREVKAKRRIIELCAAPMVDITAPGDGERQYVPGEGPSWGEPVLRALAEAYADYPDYCEEWRP
jgi:hypothetical protein